MAFTLKQALEFNKFTTGLAAAGFAFAATVGVDGSGQATPTIWVRWGSTLAVAFFATAFFFGTLVLGRATKIEAKDDERVNDALMKGWGQAYTWALLGGLFFSAALMLNKIWKWV